MLEIDRKGLLDAVAVLSKIAVKDGVPTSEQMKIETADGKVHLSATGDLNCLCRVPVKGELKKSTAVQKSVFCAFVEVARSLDSESPFIIEEKDGLLQLKNGRRSVKLPTKKPIGNYGCVSGSKWAFIKEPENLRAKVSKASIFSAGTNNEQDLNCVYLSPEGILAADRKSGVSLKLVGMKKFEPLFVPLPFVDLWAAQKTGKLYVSKKMIRYRSSKLIFEHPLPAKHYFPYNKFQRLQKVPSEAEWMEFGLGSLQQAASRFTSYMPLTADNEKVLYLDTRAGKTQAYLRMRMGGNEVSEKVKFTNPAKVDGRYAFGASYVFKLANNVTSKDTISVATFKKAALFWFKAPGMTFYLSKLVV